MLALDDPLLAAAPDLADPRLRALDAIQVAAAALGAGLPVAAPA